MSWLLNWRQTVWITVLVSLLWSGGLVRVAPAGQEQLAGWWLGQVQQSGYGHQPSEWVTRRVNIPVWLAQGQAWAVVGGWLGLTLGLGWQIWSGGSSLWSCGLLTLASHQVRTGVQRLAAWQRWEAEEMVWAGLVETVTELSARPPEPGGMTIQARHLSTSEAEGLPELKERAVSPAEEMGRLLAELVADQPLGTNLGAVTVYVDAGQRQSAGEPGGHLSRPAAHGLGSSGQPAGVGGLCRGPLADRRLTDPLAGSSRGGRAVARASAGRLSGQSH